MTVRQDEPGNGVLATTEVDQAGNVYTFRVEDDRVVEMRYGKRDDPTLAEGCV